jgi:hypothetical protein
MRMPIEHVQPLVIQTTIDGTDVTVSPITVGQYPALFAHLGPLLATVSRTPEGLFERLQAGDATGGDLAWLAELVQEHGAHLIAALAVAVNRPRDWVAGLLVDRVLELVVIVLQVNGDFFSRARATMAALLAHARAALPATPEAAVPSTGPMPSMS